MTTEEVKRMVETKTYREAREYIRGMDCYELQMLHYWAFKLQKYIFCSAATSLLHEHYGTTPNYELTGERMSEYT
jgi:hypothetical protein